MGQTRIDLLIDLEYQKALERLKKDIKGTGFIKISPSVNLAEIQKIKTHLESMLGNLSDFRFTTDKTGKIKNFFATYKNELNQTVQAQYKLNDVLNEQGEIIGQSLDFYKGKYLDSIKKREQAELKSNEAMEKAFIESERRKIQEKENFERQQALFINKALEDNYKTQLKNEENILKSKQESSDLARKMIYEENQKRLNISTDFQKQLERNILNSNKTIDENNKRLTASQVKNYEDTWMKLLNERDLKEKDSLNNLKLYAKEYERIAKFQSQGGFDFSKQSVLEGGKLVGKGVISETAEFTRFFQEIDDGTGKIRKYTMETDKASGATKILSSGWREAQREHKTFNQELSIAIRRIVEWAIATNLIYGSLKKLREGYTFVYDLSNSLNQIRIVTGQSVENVNRLAKSYNELAIAMGSTTKEITNSAVEYYRQGLSQDEANKRMEATIKYSKISGLAMKESTDIITAAANGTKRDVNEIIDVFANLGDSTASGADEIGVAMSKVAASAETAGVPFEKMAAYIATVSSITRESSENIGNSFKSLMARYTQIREKGFNDEDAENINTVTKALKAMNVNAIDPLTGQLRPFADVIDEVGKKFKDFDGNTQKYVATALGGTYQMNRLLTLLNNYPEALKNVEVAYNSTGVAQQKFDIYMESNEAKANIFKSTIEQLWLNTFNSEQIGRIIEMGTNFVQWADNVGLVNIAIIALTSTIIIFSNNIVKSLVAVQNFIKGIITMNWTMAAINPVVSALALAIGGLIVAFNLYEQHQQKVYENTIKNSNAFIQQKKDVDELMNSIVDLAGKEKLSVEEKTRMGKVTAELQKMYPDILDNLDLEKIKYEDLAIAVRKATEEKRREALQDIENEKNKIKAQINNIERETFTSGFTGVITPAREKATAARIDGLKKKLAELNAMSAEVMLGGSSSSDIESNRLRYGSTTTNTSTTTTTGGSSSSKSSTESDISPSLIEADRYAFLNTELERTNNLLAKNKALQENVDDKRRVELLKEEQELLKQKQANLYAINEERRKERDELVKNLQQQGVLFEGQGDLINAKNAELILQKKIDEVNAHRNDKDKTTYNKLKEQYEDLNNQLRRFIELQTKDIPDASVEWWNLQKAIGQAGEEINKTFENTVEDLVELEKKLDKIELDKKEKQLKLDIQNLEKSIYGTTQKEWENIHNNLIDSYEQQIEVLERKADLEDEIIERQKRQLEIQELQNKLTNLKSQKTVQIHKQQADGSWQFEYTYDQQAVEEVQSEIKKKQEELNEWELDNQRRHEIQRLRDQIEAERRIIEFKRISYETQKANLELAFQKEKEAYDLKYQDINNIVFTRMEEIKATHNGKLDEMIKDASGRLQTLQNMYQQALALQAAMAAMAGAGGSGNSSSTPVVVRDTGGVLPHGVTAINLSGKDEQVLNPEQTKAWVKLVDDLPSVMKTVDIARNLVSNIKLPNFNNLAKTTSQIFQISKLEFPNVTDATGIQEAILTLPQVALQKTKSK